MWKNIFRSVTLKRQTERERGCNAECKVMHIEFNLIWFCVLCLFKSALIWFPTLIASSERFAWAFFLISVFFFSSCLIETLISHCHINPPDKLKMIDSEEETAPWGLGVESIGNRGQKGKHNWVHIHLSMRVRPYNHLRSEYTAISPPLALTCLAF